MLRPTDNKSFPDSARQLKTFPTPIIEDVLSQASPIFPAKVLQTFYSSFKFLLVLTNFVVILHAELRLSVMHFLLLLVEVINHFNL